jgi:hypothetical protein
MSRVEVGRFGNSKDHDEIQMKVIAEGPKCKLCHWMPGISTATGSMDPPSVSPGAASWPELYRHGSCQYKYFLDGSSGVACTYSGRRLLGFVSEVEHSWLIKPGTFFSCSLTLELVVQSLFVMQG